MIESRALSKGHIRANAAILEGIQSLALKSEMPKKGIMKHAESTEDLEAGPLLDKDEDHKQLAPQDVPGRILGLPVQLVAGICLCCGISTFSL